MSADTTPVMRDLGNLKKMSAASGEKFARAQSMVEKNFLLPRNHDTPWENNGPSLIIYGQCSPLRLYHGYRKLPRIHLTNLLSHMGAMLEPREKFSIGSFTRVTCTRK